MSREHSMLVHLEVLDPALKSEEQLAFSLIDRLYAEQRRYGSDGVRGYDSESLNQLVEALGLPEEWGLPETANTVYLEPEHAEAVARLKAADFEVTELQARLLDPETGEVGVRPLDYFVNVLEALGEYYASLADVEEVWHELERGRPDCEGRTHSWPYAPDDDFEQLDEPGDESVDDQQGQGEYPDDYGHL